MLKLNRFDPFEQMVILSKHVFLPTLSNRHPLAPRRLNAAIAKARAITGYITSRISTSTSQISSALSHVDTLAGRGFS